MGNLGGGSTPASGLPLFLVNKPSWEILVFLKGIDCVIENNVRME